METKATHKGQVFIPESYSDAWFMHKTGWTWDDLRSCPAWLVEQIRYIWQIEEIAGQTNSKPKSKPGKQP